jgi:hypothetical protein
MKMVRKYQTTVGSFGSRAKERAGERVSSEGRQVEGIDHRASGGKHPEAHRRQRGEARQCCGIQMEQCDCVLALLHAHNKNPYALHPILWQFSSFVKTPSLIRNTIQAGFPASTTRF